MLKIFTDNRMSDKNYLINIEEESNIDEAIIGNMYTDEISVEILRNIEGVTSRKGKYVDAKFGTISIMDISTGCKALLLSFALSTNSIVSMDEVGDNAIKLLAKLSQQRDVDIVTHRVLQYFPDSFGCYVNGEYCIGEDISYALAEILDKETF